MNDIMWYNKFEDDWMCALPLGNGKIAAMVYGNPDTEKLQINEESLWSGRQIKEKNHATSEALNNVLKLLFEEKNDEAESLANDTFLASPPFVRFYETFGELIVDYDDKSSYSDYCKKLDLSKAIANVSYIKNSSEYQSESFISEKHNVLVYKMQEKGTSPFSCNITFKRKQDAYTSALDDNTLIVNGRVTYKKEEQFGDGGEGMSFAGVIKVVSDGKCIADKSKIYVTDATYLIIYSSYATNYNVNTFDIDESIDYKAIIFNNIENAVETGYDALREEHISSHKEQYSRVSLNINNAENDEISTDERLKAVKDGLEDDALAVLYFNFGRYLLLCSSGKIATLPANLQGKWCNDFTPPWGSDYHTNINLQMNYWPAMSLNMQETMKPLIHFVKMLSRFGKSTAKELYDAKGWVVHHTTDIFGRTGIHDGVTWGFFPMAASWLCLNLWEVYEYSRDKAFLEEIYPVIKEACEFLLDFLVEAPDGYLVTNPSNSPENEFYYGNEHKISFFTYGATFDFQVIYAIFTKAIYACTILNKDMEFSKELELTLDRLPPMRISERYGTIQEWIKDYEEVEPGHRHISHLFGLYPGDQINERNSNIYEAAKKTIERRIENGGGSQGWSRAWTINFYARFKDGNNAYKHLMYLMRNCTSKNLLDIHPPFQIDGNFGGIAGINEMLVQSHGGEIGSRIIELLPALPDKWHSGHANGLCVRGGFVVDIKWEENKVTHAKIKANTNGVFRLKLNEKTHISVSSMTYTMYDGVAIFFISEDEELNISFN